MHSVLIYLEQDYFPPSPLPSFPPRDKSELFGGGTIKTGGRRRMRREEGGCDFPAQVAAVAAQAFDRSGRIYRLINRTSAFITGWCGGGLPVQKLLRALILFSRWRGVTRPRQKTSIKMAGVRGCWPIRSNSADCRFHGAIEREK